MSAIRERIETLIANHDVLLFMKGSADFPMCGFSALAVTLLQRLEIPFHDVDVLSDPALRAEIKIFSDWPTTPQLYVRGQFIGGSDIMREMYESGELRTLLAAKSDRPETAAAAAS